MDEVQTQIFRILAKIWLHRRLVASLTFVFAFTGWFVVYSLPNSYSSETKVYVDTTTMLGRSLRGLAVESEDTEGEFLNMARSLLLSESNLETVARDLDLDIASYSPAQWAGKLNELKQVTVSGESTTGRGAQNIVTISYSHTNPERAYSVVSGFLDVFLETMVGSSQQDAKSTERFLEQKLSDYRAKLESAEVELKEFKRLNSRFLPETGSNYFGELNRVAALIRERKLEILELQKQRNEYWSQIQSLSVSQQSRDSLQSPVTEELQELRSRLLELLLKYTDEHPEVVALKRTISVLEEGKVQSSDVSEDLLDSVALSGNRVLEELRIELSTLDANLASQNARLQSDLQRLEELEDAIDTVPEIEAESAKLTRDYDINKSQYDELLTRLEATRLSMERDLSEGDVVFRVIEAPRVPQVPDGPARLELSFAVLVGSLVAGMVIAFGITQIRPTFRDVVELSDQSPLPIIGTVSEAGPLTHSREFLLYGLLFVGLVILYCSYVYVTVLS